MSEPETTGIAFLDEKIAEIHARVEELRPRVDEYNRLEAAESALAGVTEEEPPRRGRPRKAS